MAYSDYGGYAYRNGKRIEDRSDFTITPEGGFGTPGIYPGFVVAAQGGNTEEWMTRPHHHVVLGDGPLFVGLHKQTSLLLYRIVDGEIVKVDLLSVKHNVPEGQICEYEGERYISFPELEDSPERRLEFESDGWKIEWVNTDEDNYYQYVRLTQPDGVVWTGFSGYGVGAGLETCGYGFSTSRRIIRLREIFPA